MRRLFSPLESIGADKITIRDKSQLHHIKDVLRLKPGEEIEVFDQKGRVYRGFIESLSAAEMVIKIKFKEESAFAKDEVKITVACAIPKKSKMEDIIDKLTQLGVEKIIPLQTERMIVRLDSRKEKARLARWEKVALNAVEQCRGCRLPVIEPVTKIKDVLLMSGDYSLKLIPALIGERKELKAVLKALRPSNIILLVGPEGDFTQGEVEAAIHAGFTPVTLGRRVLRVETAAIAVVSILKYVYTNTHE
ncbi:MAG: RsmE family RNA methyltransferase [Candidatus Omnitrophota bacterium]